MRSTIRLISAMLLLGGLCGLGGCAGLSDRLAPATLPPHEIVDRVAALRRQQNVVRTLSWTGTLILEAQGSRSEAMVLIVARRDPSTIRIEITHGWGRPLLHIQVEESRVDVVSFSEKRHYQGRLGDLEPLKEIPFPLNPGLIWSLARAYPAVPPVRYAESRRENQITLTDDRGGAIQTIDFSPDRRPLKVRLADGETALSFFDYQDQDGILYAGKVRLTDPGATTTLTLYIREMAFNRPLPEAIFSQEVPAGFEVVTF